MFTFEEVNIESDDELLKKYIYDIPVVTINGIELFKHRVDPEKFSASVAEVEKL